MFKILKPSDKAIIVHGKVLYYRPMRASSIIRLKKAILSIFTELKTSKDIFYKIEYHWDHHKTIQALQEAKESKSGVPLLLYICKEDKTQ